ncbi:MAG TPA: OsmC family protein [Nitrososphaeraceae archaeon]|nr:OsmC family protein [Nitrososphaeraceae archaeon]
MNDKKNREFNGLNTQKLNTVFESMRNHPEMAKVTFSVKSEWNGGFSVMSTSKGFRIGGQNIERNTEYKTQYDFPNQLSGEGIGPTVCESCMSSLAACLTQTIVAHATSRDIQIDGINIEVEGDVDMRGFTGISNDIRPGAQQFRVHMNIKSNTASKEQINELYEIGKRFSPAFDTLTNGTSVVLVSS